MSILRRMKDITAATLNERLEQSEDPVRLIDRFLAGQQEQIQQSEWLLRQCTEHAQSLRTQYLNAKHWKEKREQQALVALKVGEDETARLALQDKIGYEQRSEQYHLLYEQSKFAIIELEDQLYALKSDYAEIVAKRNYYQARLESVRLQQLMNDHKNRHMSGMESGCTPHLFQCLEDSVSDMELETRSLRDLRRKMVGLERRS